MVYKILAAINRFPNSKAGFDAAIALTKVPGANLMLLHVLSSEEAGGLQMPMLTSREDYPVNGKLLEHYWKQWQTYEQAGLELLRSCTDTATNAGVSNEFIQNSGNPGREFCAVARTWSAALIVLSRRGHAGLNELILGSISNYVFHHAPCSVHVVHVPVALKTEASVANQAQFVH